MKEWRTDGMHIYDNDDIIADVYGKTDKLMNKRCDLIAAAPDLLGACQYILSRLSPPEGSNTNAQHILYDGSLHPTDDDKTVVDYLQEAIKKATE